MSVYSVFTCDIDQMISGHCDNHRSPISSLMICDWDLIIFFLLQNVWSSEQWQTEFSCKQKQLRAWKTWFIWGERAISGRMQGGLSGHLWWFVNPHYQQTWSLQRYQRELLLKIGPHGNMCWGGVWGAGNWDSGSHKCMVKGCKYHLTKAYVDKVGIGREEYDKMGQGKDTLVGHLSYVSSSPNVALSS